MKAKTANIEDNRKYPNKNDALVIVDVQNDFLPGGALAVPAGNLIIPALKQYIHLFKELQLPIIATRDWHPEYHCSFKESGGIWPRHCVAGTTGAQISNDLELPENTIIISKATTRDNDAYSGLQETDLDAIFSELGIKRVWAGGLATDYCVLETVKDFLERKYEVILLMDAIRGVNVNSGDDARAEQKMIHAGAQPITTKEIL